MLIKAAFASSPSDSERDLERGIVGVAGGVVLFLVLDFFFAVVKERQ